MIASWMAVRSLESATSQTPDAGLVIYNRASGRTRRQVGMTKKLLHEKTLRVLDSVERISPRRVVGIVEGVENGEIDGPRPLLTRAIDLARQLSPSAIVTAFTVNRFVRSAGDHRAWPTREEFGRLRALAGGVILATVIPPNTDEGGQHSAHIKRSGRAGRPVAIEDDVAGDLFKALQWAYPGGGCHPRIKFGISIRKLLVRPEFRHLTRSAVMRALERRSPDGHTWMERLSAIGVAKFDDPSLPDSV